MADEKEVSVKIKSIFDDTGAKKAKESAEDLGKGTKKTGSDAAESTKQVRQLNDQMGNLLKISGSLALISGGAFRLMSQSVNQYVSQVGATEDASKKWLLANQSIEMSGTRLGRVFEQQALPYMEKFTDLMDHAASFAEDPKNAGLIDVGMKAVAGGLVVGSAGTAVSLGAKLFGAAKGLLGAAGGASTVAAGALNAAGGIGSAAYGPATAGAAAVAVGTAAMIPIILSTIGGAVLGGIGNEVLANSDFGKKIGVQNLNKWATVLGYEATKLMGGSEQQALSAAKSIGQATGAISTTAGQSSATDTNNSRLEGNLAQQIIAYNQYYRQEEQAQRAHLIQLGRAQRTFDMQQEYQIEDFNKQKNRSQRDFNRQEAMTEFQFQRQRSIATRDFNIQLARSDQDYQRSRSRAAQDHTFDLQQIMRSGDAYSYYLSERSYKLQQSRAAEDYNISKARSEEDFSRSQNDQAQSFEIERQFRLQSYEIQRADAQQDFDINRERQQIQYAIQLKDMEQDYKEQQLMRKQAVTDALNTMAGGTEYAAKLFTQFTGSMIQDMNYLAGSAAQLQDYYRGLELPATNMPSHDSGGYTRFGPAMVHDGEFVLTSSTTKAAERKANGRLDQSNILNLSSGKPGSYSISVEVHGEMTPSLRSSVRNEIYDVVSQSMGRN